MTDETPDKEIEKTEDSGEHEEPETETTEDTSEDELSSQYSSNRPYINYTASARRGCIWNSTIGLAVVGILVSKGMDLAYRVFIEREKTKRAENQKQQ